MPPPLFPIPFSVLKAGLHVSHAAISTLFSVSLASTLVNHAWKQVPAWIKEDPAFFSSLTTPSQESTERDPDNMSSLNNIIEKLQALVAVGSSKLEKPMEAHRLHSSLLAYIQLMGQIQERMPEVREEIYKNAGLESFSSEYNQLDLDLLDRSLDFAVWAYDEERQILEEKLEEVGFRLIHHQVSKIPGYVGYFVALSEEENTLVIGIKGTSSLEDLLTDCCGRAVTYNERDKNHDCEYEIAHSTGLPSDDIENNEVCIFVDDVIRMAYCHEGILITSKRVADEVQHFVEAHGMCQGYKVHICGHSLGGGVASLLALILRSRIPSLLHSKNTIQVFSFGCPPVLDHDTAIACSPFTTTIVNNADIISRCSMSNLFVFLDFLQTVSLRLESKGMGLNSYSSMIAFTKQLLKGAGGEMIMSWEEIKYNMELSLEKVALRDPNHLYVPGKVLILYDGLKKQCEEEDDDNPSLELDGGIEYLYVRRDSTNIGGVLSDGTTSVLRLFEVDSARMFTDHMTASYYTSLKHMRAVKTNKRMQ